MFKLWLTKPLYLQNTHSLVVDEALVGDDGLYQCTAENEYGITLAEPVVVERACEYRTLHTYGFRPRCFSKQSGPCESYGHLRCCRFVLICVIPLLPEHSSATHTLINALVVGNTFIHFTSSPSISKTSLKSQICLSLAPIT